MTQCKVDSCRNERMEGRSRCPHHHKIYLMRREHDASLPKCACGNVARSGTEPPTCGQCIQFFSLYAERKEMTLEQRIENLEKHVFKE